MSRFTSVEKEAMQRLVERAKKKKFICDIVLNAYDSQRYHVDVFGVLRYVQAEPSGSSLEKDVYTLFSLMMRGVEIHEVVGDAVIDDLIEERKQFA